MVRVVLMLNHTSSCVSLQESWCKFLSDCKSLSPEHDCQTPLDSREAMDLLLDSHLVQEKCCPAGPIMLSCFLNNVVSVYTGRQGTAIPAAAISLHFLPVDVSHFPILLTGEVGVAYQARANPDSLACSD